MHTRFWCGDVRERDHLENLGIDVENVKMDLQEVEWGRDWLDLAQNGDRLGLL
jgi:hypothetical protein